MRKPAALLVDVDGTISPIAADPLAAGVLPGCRLALEKLAEEVYLVGVLSGRHAEQARSMVGLESLEYWGGHGVMHFAQGKLRIVPEAEKHAAAVQRVEEVIRSWDPLPGVLVEPKGTSVAVHYRLTPDPARARELLFARLAPLARTFGLDLLQGRMVFEARPPGLGKGWCIQKIVHERGLAGVVYFGDDQTDAEAFAAIDAWRKAGPDRVGVTVAVKNQEAPSRLPFQADYVVDGVHSVEQALLAIASALKP